ncbi:hypothetical protein CYMTET_16487 [Cymbomonas tetramitiformis]|uniref:Uncharacterized protein n=1 Tax=Cymbomonas tetramitiformis TaxID=36881 RepID=A0AAE0GC38_9CHLO|nr:hypothetical protein CYMTET_16487 [Cymbomonas tetramitiformis]
MAEGVAEEGTVDDEDEEAQAKSGREAGAGGGADDAGDLGLLHQSGVSGGRGVGVTSQPWDDVRDILEQEEIPMPLDEAGVDGGHAGCWREGGLWLRSGSAFVGALALLKNWMHAAECLF